MKARDSGMPEEQVCTPTDFLFIDNLWAEIGATLFRGQA
jgi:hypothetical protein